MEIYLCVHQNRLIHNLLKQRIKLSYTLAHQTVFLRIEY